MKLTLKVWRQKSDKEKGKFELHEVDNVLEDMSFFEMLDMLNNKLNNKRFLEKAPKDVVEKIRKRSSILVEEITTKLKATYKKVFDYPTRVSVSHTNKQDASLITLETLDQPHLLSKVANIFLDHGISIDSARITTLGEKVEDNFTVMDEKTKLCISQNKTNQLQKRLKNL